MENRFIVFGGLGQGEEVEKSVWLRKDNVSNLCGDETTLNLDCGGEYIKLHVAKLYGTKHTHRHTGKTGNQNKISRLYYYQCRFWL